MGLEIESMAIEMPEVEGHPNRVGFRGVLTMVDVASDRAPSGSRGHRVVLTRKSAEAAIPSLLGMALDYAPSFDRHDMRRKVGVITRAEVVGRAIEIGGFLYARDFPEVVAEIEKTAVSSQPLRHSAQGRLSAAIGKGRPVEAGRGRGQLGMSYEIADAQIEDMKARVWVLNKVTFTGAAILRRDKAAYQGTWIELERQATTPE